MTTETSNILIFKQNTEYEVSPSLSHCYERLLDYIEQTEDLFANQQDCIHSQLASWIVHERPKVIVCPSLNSICWVPPPRPSQLFGIIAEYISRHRKRSKSKNRAICNITDRGDSNRLIISTVSSVPSVEQNQCYLSCLSFLDENLVSLDVQEIRFAISCWIVGQRIRCACRLYCANSGNEQLLYRGIRVPTIFAILFRSVRDDYGRTIRLRSIRRAGSMRSHNSLCNRKTGFGLRTRFHSATISKCITDGSRSKEKIQYVDGKRHCLGQPVKLTALPPLLMKPVTTCTLPDSVISERLLMLRKLEGIHATLFYIGLESARDKWEEWIDNAKHLEDCDVAFMALIIIIMSSSTSDTNLANIVPRLFSAGLTSARGVFEIVQQYGVDSLCSLMSESGRFYQNTERILNAADYFLQQHHGMIPADVTVNELCQLLGVGYKTANIVVTTAFKRIEGIPSDIHVIRWCALLGWTTSRSLNGLECSKQLEQWLPKSYWGSINPLFGAFGQLITSKSRKELFSVVDASNDRHVVQLFEHAHIEYRRKKAKPNTTTHE